jgi:hypothetical protein
MLQKWHRNNIFNGMEGVGLDPKEFDLNDSDAEVRIKHKWSASCFVVRGAPGHYTGFGVIGDGPETSYDVYSWDALISRVWLWLQLVKRDLDTPDLWAELQRETKLLEVGTNDVSENTRFTLEEQKEIAKRLAELAKHVSHTHSLSHEQMQALEEKLDYLVDASGRLGRKDWLNAFIGVTLTFMLSAALAPESARTIFLTFLRAIGFLYPELSIGD